jgi:hypothetical protein
MSRALVIGTVLGLPVLIGAVILGPAAFDVLFHRQSPERFLIPAGYQGWARIEFRQTGAPQLSKEDGRTLFKLDEHAFMRTSSDPPTNHNDDEFYYYEGERRTPISHAGVCKGGSIWQIETMVDEPTSTPFTRFFVGTEAQYRHEVDPNGTKFPACEH